MAAPSGFRKFIDAIVTRDIDAVARQLRDNPALATMAYGGDAGRRDAPSIFYTEIRHYMYGGDTPLHMAAAAFCQPIAALLIAGGADIRAINRRGAEPLHYAADANKDNPAAQADTIRYLLSAGADANAIDRSGVAPLHRAVRTRSFAAVQALLDGGANPRKKNRSGSTPLFLSRRNTGRSGSGSPAAIQERERIEALLIAAVV